MFVAYNGNGCSTAPLTQYEINPIYQYITPEGEYRKNTKDDRIYIDIRRSQGYTDELEKLLEMIAFLLLLLILRMRHKRK